MKFKKFTALLTTTMIAASMLTGCGSDNAKTTQAEKTESDQRQIRIPEQTKSILKMKLKISHFLELCRSRRSMMEMIFRKS